MGRTKLTLKPFIDCASLKGYKKGFKVLPNGDMKIESPRKKKGFNTDYEEIHKDYEKYNKRKYRGYSKCKGNIIAAIKKSKLYKIKSNKNGVCIFYEERCDSSPGSSGYGSDILSPVNASSHSYLDEVSSPKRRDFLENGFDIPQSSGITLPLDSVEATFVEESESLFEGLPQAYNNQEFPEIPSSFVEQNCSSLNQDVICDSFLPSDLEDLQSSFQSPPLSDEQFNDVLKSETFPGTIDFLNQKQSILVTRVLPENMGRTKLTLKPFIDCASLKGYKKGFKVLPNGDMEIKSPRKKKGFNTDYEEIHKDYEKYNKRKYRGYSKCKGNIIAAIKKSKLYKIKSNKNGVCIFYEVRCDSSPGSSGYGSDILSPVNASSQNYLDEVSSPKRRDFSENGFDIPQSSGITLPLDSVEATFVEESGLLFEGLPQAYNNQEFPEIPSSFVEQNCSSLNQDVICDSFLPSDFEDFQSSFQSPPLSDEQYNDLLKSETFPGTIDFLDQKQSILVTRVLPGNSTLLI